MSEHIHTELSLQKHYILRALLTLFFRYLQLLPYILSYIYSLIYPILANAPTLCSLRSLVSPCSLCKCKSNRGIISLNHTHLTYIRASYEGQSFECMTASRVGQQCISCQRKAVIHGDYRRCFTSYVSLAPMASAPLSLQNHSVALSKLQRSLPSTSCPPRQFGLLLPFLQSLLCFHELQYSNWHVFK